MSAISNGGAVFPLVTPAYGYRAQHTEPGISLRDHIATQLYVAMVLSADLDMHPNDIATLAVIRADALLKALNGGQS